MSSSSSSGSRSNNHSIAGSVHRCRMPPGSWHTTHDTPAVPLPQALQGCKLQQLHLNISEAEAMRMDFVGRLTPALTLLTCSVKGGGVVSIDDVRNWMSPAAVPLVAFGLTGSMTLDTAQRIIELLPVAAPQLQELCLTATLGDEQAPPAPHGTSQLSLLTSLRTLTLSGEQLVEALAPSLPAMPALTRLQLPDATLPMQPSVLAAMTQLTYLQLGARHCGVNAAGGDMEVSGGSADDASYLPAIKQMRSLATLVLDLPQTSSIPEPEMQQMVPPPSTLRSLVVTGADEETQRLVFGVLGQHVDDVYCNVKVVGFPDG
jgi:hypothetical protein